LAKLRQTGFFWLSSTGRKTEAGKAAVSQNAYKGGAWRLLRELSSILRQQNRQLIRHSPGESPD